MSLVADVRRFNSSAVALLTRARNRTVMGVVNEAQRPVGAGGRMPVDTGFLRRSIRAAIGKAPDESSGSPLSVLSFARLDQDVYIGWHAEYAWFQELRKGFMRGALSNVQRHADAATR